MRWRRHSGTNTLGIIKALHLSEYLSKPKSNKPFLQLALSFISSGVPLIWVLLCHFATHSFGTTVVRVCLTRSSRGTAAHFCVVHVFFFLFVHLFCWVTGYIYKADYCETLDYSNARNLVMHLCFVFILLWLLWKPTMFLLCCPARAPTRWSVRRSPLTWCLEKGFTRPQNNQW